MKELTVISGKGGTGKTSLAASFATLAANALLADCDVDAPDLHLLFSGRDRERQPVYGPELASIELAKCTRCERCLSACRFQAVIRLPSGDFFVDTLFCRGCDACRLVCPEGAIKLSPNPSGEVIVSDTSIGPLVQARLRPGAAGFSKLVVAVRDRAATLAAGEGKELVIIDGPAGTGCTAIASLSGADLALIVAEPTLAGLHGGERVLALARHFGVPTLLCVNKWDLNPEMARRLERWAAEAHIHVVGRIPFDRGFGRAVARGVPFTELDEASETGREAVVGTWRAAQEVLDSIGDWFPMPA